MTKEHHQLTIFDVSSEKSERFNIYHDESGTDIAHSRFQLHGVLMIPTTKLKTAFEHLQNARNGYEGQIHFVDLRDKAKSPKAIVAAKWLQIFFTDISDYCFYKCLMVDMQSPGFDQSRFASPYLLYNNTALLAMYGGIVWSLKKYDTLILSIFSEALSRSKDDNFDTYIPKELTQRAHNNKNCPNVLIPSMNVTLVNGDPRKVELSLKEHCEFIQLTDVITGAVSQAINAKATQEVKIDLGELVANWMDDTRLPPWLQRKQLHRRFSVSCYPNHKGEFYDVHITKRTQNQLQLDMF
jgi:hypothetical protein